MGCPKNITQMYPNSASLRRIHTLMILIGAVCLGVCEMLYRWVWPGLLALWSRPVWSPQLTGCSSCDFWVLSWFFPPTTTVTSFRERNGESSRRHSNEYWLFHTSPPPLGFTLWNFRVCCPRWWNEIFDPGPIQGKGSASWKKAPGILLVGWGGRSCLHRKLLGQINKTSLFSLILCDSWRTKASQQMSVQCNAPLAAFTWKSSFKTSSRKLTKKKRNIPHECLWAISTFAHAEHT